MSVVNKMLKDLEAREGDDKTHVNYQPPVKKTQRLRIWMYGLVTAAVLVIVFALVTVPEESREPRPATPDMSVITDGGAQTANDQTAVDPLPVPVVEPKTEKKTGSLLTRPISELVAATKSDESKKAAETAETRSSGSMRAVSEPTQEAISGPVAPVKDDAQNSRFELTPTTSSDKQTQNLRERIRLALAKPDKREAIVLLGELIDAEPDNVAVRKKLAAILFAEGQVSGARDVLVKTLQMSPADHSVRLMLARLYIQQGQPEAAATVLEDANRYRPLSVDLLAFRAAAAQERDNYAAALSDYNQLAAMAPDQARWWLGVGTSADKLGEGAVARRAYQQALSLRQLSSDVHRFMTQRIEALAGGDDE